MEQGYNPSPLKWQHRVLTTGQPGNSQCYIFYLYYFHSHVDEFRSSRSN